MAGSISPALLRAIAEARAVKQRLEAARAALARFEFVRCGMAHERIRREPGGQEPLPNPAVDHGLLRAEYCDGETRSTRLACAHTGARRDFIALLDALPSGVTDGDRIASWKEEIERLDLAIIDVDWRKSDAELAHARQSAILCADGGDAPENVHELGAIAAGIQDLVREHRSYVDRLREIRNEVRAEIHAAIEGGRLRGVD